MEASNELLYGIVISDFISSNSGELNLSIGDKVAILKQENNIYSCLFNEKIVNCPSSCIKIIGNIKEKEENIPIITPRSPNINLKHNLPIIPSRPTILSQYNHKMANRITYIPYNKKTKSELRLDCLMELYYTERDYVEDLQTIVDVFITPMRIMQVLSDYELHSIFSNIEILVNCNREFLNQIEEQCNLENEDDVRLGKIFITMCDYFKMYVVFCANQQISMNCCENYQRTNRRFRRFLEICYTDPRCRGLYLQSFLIKPISRICKYPLLIRDLIKHTPENHPDHTYLVESLEKINDIVSYINERRRTAENLNKICEIQKEIEGFNDLIVLNRMYVKEGIVNFYKSDIVDEEEYKLFLFTDIIILCKEKEIGKYKFIMSITLEDTTIQYSDNINNTCAIIDNKNNITYILACNTQGEIRNWVKSIKQEIKQIQKKKAYNAMKTKGNNTK